MEVASFNSFAIEAPERYSRALLQIYCPTPFKCIDRALDIVKIINWAGLCAPQCKNKLRNFQSFCHEGIVRSNLICKATKQNKNSPISNCDEPLTSTTRVGVIPTLMIIIKCAMHVAISAEASRATSNNERDGRDIHERIYLLVTCSNRLKV